MEALSPAQAGSVVCVVSSCPVVGLSLTCGLSEACGLACLWAGRAGQRGCGKSFQVGPVPSGQDNRALDGDTEGRTEQLGEARALEKHGNLQVPAQRGRPDSMLLQVHCASGPSPALPLETLVSVAMFP